MKDQSNYYSKVLKICSSNHEGKSFYKDCRKRKSVGKQQFFLLSTVLFTYSDNLYHLTHYQITNFRLFQTERVCRR